MGEVHHPNNFIGEARAASGSRGLRQTVTDESKRGLWVFERGECGEHEELEKYKEQEEYRVSQPYVPEKTYHQNQQSEKSKELLADIKRVAARPYNILITGETGTGKTFAARQIHQASARAKSPFMELNCANFSEHLVEAELFGYRKGAFTGADRDHKGLFEEASGGILFLDEIGDIPPVVQNKLLKAIDEKKIKRLGTNRYIECDVQIIAATSRNLTEMVRQGDFREDLYCRLAVLKIEVPPLRERREDIPALIDFYLREAAQLTIDNPIQNIKFKIEQGAFELLLQYDYPGNIRVLKNLIYELTSYVQLDEPISIELVQTALEKFGQLKGTVKEFAVAQSVGHQKIYQKDFESGDEVIKNNLEVSTHSLNTSLQSIAGEDDIVLPLEVCIIRRGETLKEWTSRAKKCSIEAARQSSDGSLKKAAVRLGISIESLRCRLHRTNSTRKYRSRSR